MTLMPAAGLSAVTSNPPSPQRTPALGLGALLAAEKDEHEQVKLLRKARVLIIGNDLFEDRQSSGG